MIYMLTYWGPCQVKDFSVQYFKMSQKLSKISKYDPKRICFSRISAPVSSMPPVRTYAAFTMRTLPKWQDTDQWNVGNSWEIKVLSNYPGYLRNNNGNQINTVIKANLYIPCMLPWKIHDFPLQSMTGWNRKAPSSLFHLASYCLANKNTAKWTESHLFPSNSSVFFIQYWIRLKVYCQHRTYKTAHFWRANRIWM